MYSYRVTKYNPCYRDEKGSFLKDEWISVGDIGRLYNGEIFKFSEYLQYENAYISAVRIVMKANGVSSLRVIDIEKKTSYDFHDISMLNAKEYIDLIKNKHIINYSNVDFCIRLILREMLWGILESPDMFVHFGYDYYMYIGSRVDLTFESTLLSELGLFVEEMPSPYI